MATPQSYCFLEKNNSPQWIPTPCLETTLLELLKSTFKEKYDCTTRISNMYWAKNFLLLVFEYFKKRKIDKAC